MNPDNVKEIIETIKTLNINFNDATTQKIAETILPIIKLYFLKEILETFMYGIVVFVLAILAYKLFIRIVLVEKEKHFKTEERMEKTGE